MVIDTFYFKYVTIFPKEFLEKYKNNPNVPQNMPSDIKNNFFSRRKFVFAGCHDPD